MKGIVKYARGEGFMELREVEELPPAPNQVKIEVTGQLLLVDGGITTGATKATVEKKA
jgi:hypothetical protein